LAELKAKVSLEATKGHETDAELATKHELHAIPCAAWKREAVEKLATLAKPPLCPVGRNLYFYEGGVS
jgi:hypothetical protein